MEKPQGNQNQDTSKSFKPISTDEFGNLSDKEQEAQLASEEEALIKAFSKAEAGEEDEETSQDEEPSNNSTEVSEEEEPSSEQSDVESEEPAPTEQDKLSKEIRQEIESLRQSYKDLQAEFTRKSQELSELKKSKDSEKDNVDREMEKHLDQLAKENPNAVKLIDYMVNKKLKEHVSPLEERTQLRDKQLFQKALQAEMAEFKQGPLSELAPEAEKLVHEVLSSFEKNPRLFSDFLLSGDSLIARVENVLYERDPDRIAELRMAWKKKKSLSKPASNKKEVGRADVGKNSGKSPSAEGVLKRLEDYSPTEFKNLSIDEMEKVLPYRSE